MNEALGPTLLEEEQKCNLQGLLLYRSQNRNALFLLLLLSPVLSTAVPSKELGGKKSLRV